MTTRATDRPGVAAAPAAKQTKASGARPAAGAAHRPRRRGYRERPPVHVALLWLGPVLLLIAGVVVYPVIELVKASVSRFSITGLRRGSAGLDNFASVLDHPALGTVLRNTAIWVVAVVALTVVIGLALAQFLSKEFFGSPRVEAVNDSTCADPSETVVLTPEFGRRGPLPPHRALERGGIIVTSHPYRRFALPLAGAVVSLAFLAPYMVMLLDSLRPSSEVLLTPTTLLPGRWQLTAYSNILSDPRFLNWLKTSLIVAVASTVIVLVVAIPAAYFTARYRFPGRIAFLFLVLVTQMLAPTSLVVGLYRQFFEANLVNTYAAIIITNAAFNLAFAV